MSKLIKSAIWVMGGLVVIGLIGVIAIQFVPVERDNPPVVSEPKWDSPQTQALVERACYDCHSNQTKWPWYSNIAPVSWLVAQDVHEGRADLNFSEWNLGQKDQDQAKEGEDEGDEGIETDEIIEEVEDGDMPLRNYLLLHPEARLTDAENEALLNGLKATFGPGAEGALSK